MKFFILGGIGKWISDAWMGIWIVINQMLYSIIELLYRVFVAVSNVNLFDRDVFDSFTNRMYIVIAMAMVFIFAYNLVLMIINPEDKKGTGQATKLVKETVISLVLIILLPTIFNYMAIFQKDVIDSQIITKIILGSGNENDNSALCDFSKYSSLNSLENVDTSDLEEACTKYNELDKAKQGAYLMTPTLLNAFFYPTKFSLNHCATFIEECNGEDLESCSSNTISDAKYNKKVCGQFFYGFKMAQYTGNLDYLIGNEELTDIVNEEDNKVLNFNYIFAVVGGIIALIMYASYTIMIGVRVAKLGFLQLIAPVPVMMRIIPKQKEAFFDKWFKELKNTYLDVFMRLIIINFALYAISLVPDVIDNLGGGGDDSLPVVLLAKAVVILGILQFGKEAPGLFKEFFGGSGKFSLKGAKDAWKGSTSKVIGAAGAVGALGYMGARSVKNIKNAGKGNRLKQGALETLNLRKAGGVIKAGYNAGEKSNLSDFASSVGDAEHNVRYKRGFFGSSKDNLDLARSKRFTDISNKFNAFEKILDGKASIQALTSTFEEQRKEAAKATYGSKEINGKRYSMSDPSQKQAYLEELDKQYKTERNKLRMVELQKGINNNDKEIIDNYEIYLDSLKENKSETNTILKEYGKSELDLDQLKIENIVNLQPDGNFFNDYLRDPGNIAGKEAGSISRRVQEKKSKSNGN